jgi:deoxyribodipyrimidine photo-lyase
VFNPVLQAEKFDPKRVYLRRYLGDFDGSAALDYPTPIVDLANARAGALEAFSHVSSLPRDIAPPTGFDSL